NASNVSPPVTTSSAIHSRIAGRAPSTATASSAVTARLDATIACTTNSGCERNAASDNRNPSPSRTSPATYGSDRAGGVPSGALGASIGAVRRAPTACKPVAAPYAIAAANAPANPQPTCPTVDGGERTWDDRCHAQHLEGRDFVRAGEHSGQAVQRDR